MKAHQQYILLLAGAIAFEVAAEPAFTAMYIFGDSFSDPGNNIYFRHTVAKANYSPYGIDFDGGPTGRFCNGKILVDFLGELLGFPLLPSYANTIAKAEDILSGVNYASAGAGILDDTGHAFGRLIPLTEQIDNFKNTVDQLRDQMQEDELSNYLARALVVIQMGSNDYLNNYLQPQLYRGSHIYNPQQFADLLINLYTGHLLDLHRLGLRKFFLAEVPPIGCSPVALHRGHAPPGECEPISNNLVQMFNSRLRSLVGRLNSDYPGSMFGLVASFQLFTDLRDNADAYGFRVKDAACCGVERNEGRKALCLPNSEPCFNRDQYLFWDYAHLTEAANRILAHRIYNTTAYCFPVTIKQMAKM